MQPDPAIPPRCRRLFSLPVLIILLAFGLRIHSLDGQGIWGDEAIGFWLSKQPLAVVMAPGSETNPPLYHVLLRLWSLLAGTGVFAIRYVSVLGGVLIIPLVYVLGVRLLRHRLAALIAAVLAALSAFHVYYSQEARFYAWAATLGLFATLSFSRLLDAALHHHEGEGRRLVGRFAIYLLAALAAAFTHYYLLFVLLAHNLYVLLRARRLRRWLLPWLVGQIALVAVFTPWNLAQARILVESQLTEANRSPDYTAWGFAGLWDIIERTIAALGTGITVSGAERWLALAALAAAVLGVIALVQRSQSEGEAADSLALILLYLLVPIAGAWAVGPFMPFFQERYLLIVLPAYLLLMAAGTAHPGMRPAVGGLLALCAAANLYSIDNYYTDPAYVRSRYGEMMAYIAENAGPDDALLLENHLQWALYDYYAPPGITAYWFPMAAGWDDPATEAELARIAAQHDRLWLVMFGNPAEYDPNFALEGWLSRNAFRAYFAGYQDSRLSMYVTGAAATPDRPVDATFGGMIHLAAYHVSSQRVTPGSVIQVSLLWEAVAPADKDYTIFTHLIDQDERILAQFDGQPQGGSKPTSTWQVGEQLVDRFALSIDPGTPPGIYWLQVGWYDWMTLERLPVSAPGDALPADRVLLCQIEVTAPAASPAQTPAGAP
ncbi:MAG: glycosyltransferase family 39 protein [Anaerolineae bacterium]